VPASRQQIDPRHPAIERYLERPRPARTVARLDAIFFDASATQSFADEAARAAFRERWLGRYLTHDAQHAYLAVVDPGGEQEDLAGYLVGSLDDPAKAARFSDLGYFRAMAHLTCRYPAQLHINLASEWRGQGVGRALVGAFCAHAEEAGVPGVHVFTSRGMRNVSFYAACGFSEVGSCIWNGREILMLGRSL
jgi:GNAT superfamily N-acetyltransferase